MRFKPTCLEGIASEILHSFQINSLHILNSGGLPAGQTLCNCLLYQKDTRNGAQTSVQPFASKGKDKIKIKKPYLTSLIM